MKNYKWYIYTFFCIIVSVSIGKIFNNSAISTLLIGIFGLLGLVIKAINDSLK